MFADKLNKYFGFGIPNKSHHKSRSRKTLKILIHFQNFGFQNPKNVVENGKN
jgi:hypothetical protein